MSVLSSPTYSISRRRSLSIVANEDTSAADVIAVVLDGLTAGRAVDDIERELRYFHREDSTFPATTLLDLAADAYLAGGWTRADRLVIDRLDERLLPEVPARGNAGHSKRRHAVHAAIMITAGVEPEDTGWWSFDDLWVHARHAAVIYIRATSERRECTVGELCELLRTQRTDTAKD